MNLNSVQLNVNNSEISFAFRENSIGDKGVIHQIFINKDYEISQWEQGRRLIEYHEKQSQINPSLIVDAGANIGASVVFFAKNYSNSMIFSIEPDKSNWHLLSINTSELNCYNYNGAIGNVDGELAFVDPGRSDWGFMTTSIESAGSQNITKVKSICPISILSHPSVENTTPLILKIDIEGGEDALFRGDVSWLDRFPLVIIELHDWMLPFSGSARNFIKAIAQFEFDIVYKGENMFLFNRNILK